MQSSSEEKDTFTFGVRAQREPPSTELKDVKDVLTDLKTEIAALSQRLHHLETSGGVVDDRRRSFAPFDDRSGADRPTHRPFFLSL